MNQKVFRLLKSAKQVMTHRICEDRYYVSDGVLVFSTTDIEALLKLGAIDFSGEPKQRFSKLEEFVDREFGREKEEWAVLTDTKAMVASSGFVIRFFKSESYLVGMNLKYFELFKPSLCKQANRLSPILLFDSQETWLGLVLPIRPTCADLWKELTALSG